jgi:hypothetical protein
MKIITHKVKMEEKKWLQLPSVVMGLLGIHPYLAARTTNNHVIILTRMEEKNIGRTSP